MRSGALATAIVAVCVTAMTAAPAPAQIGPRAMTDVTSQSMDSRLPGPFHFVPLGQDVLIPAGESARFEIRSAGFSRAAVLAAGGGASEEGMIGIVTLFGPPLVPAGPPVPLGVGPGGRVAGHALSPVIGPAMVVIVNNGTTSDVTLTLSAYLTR